MEENKEQTEKEVPKHRGKLEALDNMSLGISIVVAILFGIGIGLLLKDWTGYTWTLWLGVFWGVAAAVLNVKKAYDKAQKEFAELSKDKKYQHAMKYGTNDKDDDD
jgi:F0F1-type ATP synthase assembly protein I